MKVEKKEQTIMEKKNESLYASNAGYEIQTSQERHGYMCSV